jgi:hypothetical protein
VPPRRSFRPKRARPTGVARLRSRRGGTNKYRLNGANYEYQGWAKLDDRSGPGLMIELNYCHSKYLHLEKAKKTFERLPITVLL